MASTFWHGLKEHLVLLCGPPTEGQRMFSLAAARWPEFSGPSGPTLTEIEKNSPSLFKTYTEANLGVTEL